MVFRILFHQRELDLAGTADQALRHAFRCRTAEDAHSLFVGPGIGQQEGLEHLCCSAAQFARRQRLQEFRVDIHEFRLAEGADHVLVAVEIHAVLAADGGVDLGQQRRGNKTEAQAACVDGSHEAGDVGGDAAAHANQERITVGLLFEQLGDETFHRSERLFLFGGVDPENGTAPCFNDAAAPEPAVCDEDGSGTREKVGYAAVGDVISQGLQCCLLRYWRCGRGACRCRPYQWGERGEPV